MTGQEIRTFKENSSPFLSVTVSPDGNYILTGSPDRAVRQISLPWTFYQKEILPELRDITYLRALGLQFEWEDVERMDREGRRWKTAE